MWMADIDPKCSEASPGDGAFSRAPTPGGAGGSWRAQDCRLAAPGRDRLASGGWGGFEGRTKSLVMPDVVEVRILPGL
jgi:hypothetical protein